MSEDEPERADDPSAPIEARLRENPWDFEAWRVYGDLLLDRGDRRGELIMLSTSGNPSEPGLAGQIATLTREVAAKSTLPRLAGEWMFGFLTGFSHRIVDTLDIGGLQRLLAHPEAVLTRSLTLEVADTLSTRALAGLKAVDLRRIRELCVINQTRGDAILRAIATRPGHRFISLDLRNAGLTHNGALALAELAQGGTLRTLHLQRNRIRGKGIVALAPLLVGLELLDLRYNAIGQVGAQALAEAPALSRLQTLRLNTRDLDEAGVGALASSTTLPRPIARYWRGVLEQRFARTS